MMRKALSILAASIAAAVMTGSPASAVEECDRDCLEGMVDDYIAAMAAHDPDRLPLAVDVEYTENGQELRLGDGLWNTVTKPGNYKIYVADPRAGQVGFIGTVYERGTPVLLALRLKVRYGVISEAEAIVARGGGNFPAPGKTLEKMEPRDDFTETVPVSERMSRERLIDVANAYFTGLARNTGNNPAPFAETCERLENGVQTTNNPSDEETGPDIVGMTCAAQQESGFYKFVTEIRDRRFPIVDRERGLVLAFGFFDHDGREMKIELSDGTVTGNPLSQPTTLEIAELFEIDQGKIDQVEAVLRSVPYGMDSDIWDQ